MGARLLLPTGSASYHRDVNDHTNVADRSLFPGRVSRPLSRARAFSLLEVMSVTAIVAIVASVAVAMGSRTSTTIQDTQNQFSVLEFIQRERNAHVNRGMDNEVLVVCAASAGGDCRGAGDELVAYRVPLPAAVPPTTGVELARQRFEATISFSGGPALVVDSYARSVTPTGVPSNVQVNIAQRETAPTIVFRQDGTVLPSFEAPAAIVVAPKITDLGTRTTPNPTPQGRTSRIPRAREVFLE